MRTTRLLILTLFASKCLIHADPQNMSPPTEPMNLISNSSFEQGETLADTLVWHRMTGSPSTVVEIEQSWVMDDQQAWHGTRSLRGNGTAPLIVSEEVWEPIPSRKSPWVFSVYLKADRPGVECQLSVGAYWRHREDRVSRTVELDTEWKRYELVVNNIPNPNRRGGNQQGPVNFIITPKNGETVWVDSLQWEKGSQALPYREHGPETHWPHAPALTFPHSPGSSLPQTGKSSWQGSVPLRVYQEKSIDPHLHPVVVGVPFNKGFWNGQGTLSLINPKGESIPVQAEILTRWPQDQSVQVLSVFFTDSLASGWQNYPLSIGDSLEETTIPEAAWNLTPPEAPGTFWSKITARDGTPLFGPASLRAIGLDGTLYDSRLDPDAEWSYERSGPLHYTLRSSGRLISHDGKSLLAFTVRVHAWRDIPGIRLELSAINSRDTGSIRLRSLFWHAEGMEPVEAFFTPEEQRLPPVSPVQVTNLYLPETDRFLTRVEQGEQRQETNKRLLTHLTAVTPTRHLLLHAVEGWQRHPSAIGWNKGQWRGYLWPDSPVRSLSLPRGMALTREFWLREQADAPTEPQLIAWDQPAMGIAAPQWWATTDIIIPFSASDPERFPFMESILSSNSLLGRFSTQTAERDRAYGVFDFGDNHGDGGWGNLESFNDWSAFLSGLRSGNIESLRVAQRGARHYRDIDTDQMSGKNYTHSLNHILGGTDFSHSWPEGIIVHYLLTGDKRSYEVMLKHGEYLLAMGLDNPSLLGTRNLSRYLTNSVNLYKITGDSRYRDRFFAQLEVAKQALAEDTQNLDSSIFSYIGHSHVRRLVPFHSWYGIIAMQRMATLSDNQELQALIHKEITATLNPELYDLDLLELWPGVSPEEGKPIMLADVARHRGSFFYPGLTTASEQDPSGPYAQLALDSLYVWAVEGRNTNNIQAIVSSPPLNLAPRVTTEKELVQKAADLLWRAAAPTLLNGDFSMSDEYWHHWRPFPGKSLSHHTNWQRRRQTMATLDSETVHSGKHSLRLNLNTDTFRSSIAVDTHRFQMDQGTHTLSGWLRWDEGADDLFVRFQVRDLAGNHTSATVNLYDQQPATASNTPSLQFISAQLDAPDPAGWRKLTLHIRVPKRVVANLYFSSKLKRGSTQGHLWIDDFKLMSQ